MNNLRKLRKQRKLTLDDIQKQTQINRGTYNNYENGTTEPKPETWQALANFFNVSVEYLQGAYSKEEIGQNVQHHYKRGGNNTDVSPKLVLIRLFNKTIDNYFISLGVIPYNIKSTDNLLKPEQINNLDFWIKYLEPLYYSNIAMKWLTTKPNLDASEEDILSAVNSAMSEVINASATTYTSRNIYDYNYEIEQVVKNHYMQKRLEFLKKHEYWVDEEIDEGHYVQYPVYDFKHPHELDNKRHYID